MPFDPVVTHLQLFGYMLYKGQLTLRLRTPPSMLNRSTVDSGIGRCELRN